MNYRLRIQYDGTRYAGWQRQKSSENTIQGKIENVLGKMINNPVQIIGASRTDAGVHAVGQVANVQLPDEARSEEDVKEYLNKYLPDDIAITEVKRVSDNFHSRFNAGDKIYRYRIATSTDKHVFGRKYIYDLQQQLDIQRMKEAAELLLGEHDFQGFCAKKMKKSSVRCLDKIEFQEKDNILNITYQGSGFLYHMVRIMTGTLIEVGLHQRTVESMNEILTKKERALAGYLVPAKGLCLMEVAY